MITKPIKELTIIPPHLTLIDFGSSAIHPIPSQQQQYKDNANQHHHQWDDDVLDFLPIHHTFVGSKFYRSPEMCSRHRSYTQKTDVWSAGVVLYVAAFGSSQCDQQEQQERILSFFYNHNKNMTHPSSSSSTMTRCRRRNWREHLSTDWLYQNLPPSYYELLDYCLTYHDQQRPNAKDVLCNSDFVQLETDFIQDEGAREDYERRKKNQTECTPLVVAGNFQTKNRDFFFCLDY